ncbi:bifunctional 2-C-methyl-D-erythritol 4-phosphate cytidylyltransferase/2-C-methyl-D-erythritol 2,4-cyclodiphosphate synthase [Helicobacter sp. MIT 99-5507]|uniref:bifunctional 2-C-methyl-D-erythritol 4-phosphate cytidylyltransferase/2-C-methyl-D-erythritol 2,4-cyclodiphosphate synthase n=1 Tax=Helicobacter sp. MIT 99-5507 TaxID=152489 RepID=UPI0021611DEA|nr:bifunctional 2-C-methyl-D-erythritol 4-phosphate cytidylyltransferase/2-C-methyl-D-erythritol 2,4-cyclodiphosphate synthase [Helicobacter sp. MIT 99-5507]
MRKNITLIIMSAGESLRFRENISIKKQWIRIDNKPMWLYVADLFQERYNFSKVIITASFRDIAYMKRFCDYEIVQGGNSRQESLQNALKYVNSEFVAVSDAARCNLDFEVLDNLFAYNLDSIDCLIPTIGVSDTIFLESNGNKNYLNRDNIHLVQTPQISRVQTLLEAIKLGDFSDESSAINNYGGKVVSIKGSKILDKITFLDDLKKLNISNNNDTFIGYGFDVHRFCKNKDMYLGGVKIPCSFGLEAHSDGDVVIHSLCDALLGAIGAGDIGEWFPPDDEKYDNIDSKILLKEVATFINSVGFRIVNIDIMIMAQVPKILPYKDEMVEIFSNILNLQRQYINIKATTMEKLGFVGRSEGVCVSSSVSLKLFL